MSFYGAVEDLPSNDSEEYEDMKKQFAQAIADAMGLDTSAVRISKKTCKPQQGHVKDRFSAAGGI